MMRMFGSFVLGSVVSLGLFYGMALLISKGKDLTASTDDENFIEFVRVKQDDHVQERKRELPKKPPEPKKAPMTPKLNVAANKPNRPNLKMNVPNLGPGVKGGLGPGFGQGGSGLGNDSDAQPLVRIKPLHPQKARMEGIEGWVKGALDINKRGEVDAFRIIEGRPPGIFEKAARNAVLQWKYRPKVINGKAVAYKTYVQLDFELAEESQ